MYFHTANMAIYRSKFRIIPLALLLLLLVVGALVQMPSVQTQAIRSLVLPKLESTLGIELSVEQCHLELWNQKLTLRGVSATQGEVALISGEKLTVQWHGDGMAPEWHRIDSISLAGTLVQTTNFKNWLTVQQAHEPQGASQNEKPAENRGFSVDHLSVFSLKGAEGKRTTLLIDEAHFQDFTYQNKSFQLPLNSLNGTAFLPVTNSGNETFYPIQVKNLTSFVQGNDSTWSIEELSVGTSLFQGNISAMAASNEWLVQLELNKSVDLSALKVPPIVEEILHSVLEDPEMTEINGRVWIDASTRAMRSAVAVHGISSIGTASDSLGFSLDANGKWGSTGSIAVEWQNIQEKLAPFLGEFRAPVLEKWAGQERSSLLTWKVDPYNQQFILDLPLSANSTLEWNMTGTEPWTPDTFNGWIQNIPPARWDDNALSCRISGRLSATKNTLELETLQGTVDLLKLTAVHHPQHGSNEQKMEARWQSQASTFPTRGDCTLDFTDSTWQFTGHAELEGIQSLGLPPSKDWSLFAKLSLRASGNRQNEWQGVLETRNISLLENNRPIAFNRLDATLKNSPDQIQLEWHSDLTNGSASASNDATAWEEWLAQFIETDKPNAPLPFLEFDGSMLNFKPISLIVGLPFDLAPHSTFSGTSDSDTLRILGQTSILSASQTMAHALELNCTIADRSSHFQLQIDSVASGESLLASEVTANINSGKEWNGSISWSEGSSGRSSNVAFQSTPPNEAHGALRLTDVRWPVYNQTLNLVEPADLIRWGDLANATNAKTQGYVALQSEDWTIAGRAHKNIDSPWVTEVELDLKEFTDSLEWLIPNAHFEAVAAKLIATGDYQNPKAALNLKAERIEWEDETISDLTFFGTGWQHQSSFQTHAKWGDGIVSGSGTFGWENAPFIRADWDATGIVLNGINKILPKNTLRLSGEVAGQLKTVWNGNSTAISGQIRTDSLHTFVPALGTEYTIEADLSITPASIQINQGSIRDRRGALATLNGTAYHNAFKDWNLDFGIDATSTPIELMNLPPKEAAYYYGAGFGTGDINIAGYGSELLIEASIAADSGTDFALPLDVISDATYAQFIQFKTTENTQKAAAKAGDFSNVVLDIGLDLSPKAIARIVFNQNTGEEIRGRTEGHLDVRVNDFEEITLNGSLKIIEGTYFFTLQNLINKTFKIQPGGALEWFGDPYAAQIDVLTSFETRARLNPLLPDETDLPGRVPVELLLSLNGGLFQPEIGFNIRVPEADSRLEALIQGALLNEEEMQRQALSLLVVNQFISQDPLASALGGFQGTGQSSAFIANQLGHWISQIAPGMDLGLDYSNDDLSGQQELALALSTQMFNERLKLEGAFGAQSNGQMSTDDIQIQDVTISYDLDSKGQYQVTGQSKSNQSMMNALDGSSTQGVGIRIRHEFNHWGDWKNEAFSRDLP